MNTADLAKAAIALSIKRHITREEALKRVLRRVPLERQDWETPDEARKKRKVLFRCVLALIPSFEPNKINANFTGKIRDSRQRFARMRMREEVRNGNPMHKLSCVLCRGPKSLRVCALCRAQKNPPAQ